MSLLFLFFLGEGGIIFHYSLFLLIYYSIVDSSPNEVIDMFEGGIFNIN